MHFRTIGSQIVVFGRTYEHKEALKALGARFNFADKSWSMPHSETGVSSLAQLCARVGGGRLGGEAQMGGANRQETNPELGHHPMRAAAFTQDAPQLEGFSLRELMNGVQLAVTQTYPSPVWVFGEISGLAQRAAGVFLALTEPKENGSEVSSLEIKATLWRSQQASIIKRCGEAAYNEVMQEGLRVRMLVQVGVFADRGQISLNILDIDPAFTKGALALAREQLLKELRAKGLDQANKLRPVSDFPLRIGLISAEGSRAYSDFVDQLVQGGFAGEIWFSPAQMQGEKTAADVIQALKALVDQDCDLVVITRGGGSAADLRWFDSKELAYAVAESAVPIVAAIGHHDDVCVVEQICFQREKTPTAAAEFLLAIIRRTKDKIRTLVEQLGQDVSALVDNEMQKCSWLQEQLGFSAMQMIQRLSLRLERLRESVGEHLQRVVRELDRRCFMLQSALERGFSEVLRRLDHQLTELAHQIGGGGAELIHRGLLKVGDLERRLVGQDPKPWMQRGWTQLVWKKQGLTRVAQISLNETLEARLLDGVLRLRVEEIEERNSK